MTKSPPEDLTVSNDVTSVASPPPRPTVPQKPAEPHKKGLFSRLFELKPKPPPVYRIVEDEQGKFRSYVGPYEVTSKVLGHGGNSIVHLGIDPRTPNKPVAIKSINVSPAKLKALGNVDNLEEVKVMKRLIYTGVCRLYDVFASEAVIYLVMEFVEGQELFDLVRLEKTLSEERALNLFSQLVTAVAYLHSMGMVHNDLKLENILVDKHDEVTIIDFGHASSGENPTFQPGIPTLDYVAPEVILYNKTSSASDVWSLGVVLYIMVIGYFPFSGSREVLRKQIIEAKVKFPRELSRECKDLIKRMLTKDPKARITLEEVKRHPFFLKSLDYYDFDSYNTIDLEAHHQQQEQE